MYFTSPSPPPTTERHWMDRGKNACKYMRTNYSKLINFVQKDERWPGEQASNREPPPPHHGYDAGEGATTTTTGLL